MREQPQAGPGLSHGHAGVGQAGRGEGAGLADWQGALATAGRLEQVEKKEKHCGQLSRRKSLHRDLTDTFVSVWSEALQEHLGGSELAPPRGVPFLSLSSGPPAPARPSLQDQDFMEPLRAGFVASVRAES